MDVPDVSYARSGDVAIAYQTVGDGPEDVMFVRGFAGDLLSVWEQPLLVRFIETLASFARVTMIDKRGTGLSDRVRDVPTLETRMDDLRAVMDAIGAEQAVLWTAQEGARLAVLFAASYPERTAGLVLFDPTAKGRLTPDYPWEPDDAEWRNRLAQIREGWGRTDFLEDMLAEWSPAQREDPEFCAWFISHMRRGLSPGSAVAFFRMMRDSDVSDVLPVVRVPTVVLSSEAQRGPAQYVAERIPGARLVELPSSLRSIYHWVRRRGQCCGRKRDEAASLRNPHASDS
jgi:pimeloyl-ACP methyl ester carboxylesterase